MTLFFDSLIFEIMLKLKLKAVGWNMLTVGVAKMVNLFSMWDIFFMLYRDIPRVIIFDNNSIQKSKNVLVKIGTVEVIRDTFINFI